MNAQNMDDFLKIAIGLSRQGMREGRGGPFGCVIVSKGQIISQAFNQVTSLKDPTAHAEILAIREACNCLSTHDLSGCELYSSCEPCPMCLGAIYWARIAKVVYANTRDQASKIGFDDDTIYKEIDTSMSDRKIPFIHFPHPEAEKVFLDWKNWEGKMPY